MRHYQASDLLNGLVRYKDYWKNQVRNPKTSLPLL